MSRIVKAEPALIAGKGRGLRAVEQLAAGEVIDCAATIALSSPDCDAIETTAIGDYYFAHPNDDQEGLVILGLASLCNHADRPNAEVRWRHEDGLGWIAELVALCAIGTGEEITRRYHCRPWFQIAS